MNSWTGKLRNLKQNKIDKDFPSKFEEIITQSSLIIKIFCANFIKLLYPFSLKFITIIEE